MRYRRCGLHERLIFCAIAASTRGMLRAFPFFHAHARFSYFSEFLASRRGSAYFDNTYHLDFDQRQYRRVTTSFTMFPVTFSAAKARHARPAVDFCAISCTSSATIFLLAESSFYDAAFNLPKLAAILLMFCTAKMPTLPSSTRSDLALYDSLT